MSQSLMDTEKGGEQTQYEGTHTFVDAPAKQGGQLGDPSPTTTTPSHPNAPNTHGITPADKIRYGQSIQEGGAGGKTTSSTGEAQTGSGFGGTQKREGDGVEEGEGFAKERRAQGYGGGADVSRQVGA